MGQPLFTHLLASKWAKEAQTPKPTALNTMLRYSGAHGCMRRMGYDWFDAQYSEPPSPASVWLAGIGTLVGAAAAEVMIETYGGVAEMPSQINSWLSGSADWFCEDTPLGSIVFEHKVKGSYAFNKALGYKRNFGKASRTEPDGPPSDAVVQAGLNALGIEETYKHTIENVVVGVVTSDIVSVSQNKQLDVSDLERFSAEWVIPRKYWEPRARREIDRLSVVAEKLDLGYLPDRLALDDNAERIFLTPGGSNWQCDYCPYLSLCKSERSGDIRFLDSKLTRRFAPQQKEDGNVTAE